MKYFFLALFLLIIGDLSAQIKFDNYFEEATMRVDYSQAGNAKKANCYFEQVKKEPYWGGSKKHLIDPFRYGDYVYEVYDSVSNKLIFSRGYSTLFREWQDTPEAKIINKSFYESVVFPFPKNTVKLKIQQRSKKNEFSTIFDIYLNPKDYWVVNQPLPYKTHKIYDSGNPSKKLDVVIIPEGYTQEEMLKFYADAERFIGYFFKAPPFKENKDKVNFWLVNAPSLESGTDIPGKNIWKHTLLNTNFYTFRSERYLTTQDVRKVRDVAACAPYDQIYILVNTKKYGGGGIYNYYNLCSSDNEYCEPVFIHEFGHGFGALADEYVYQNAKLEDYYLPKVEPWAVNITTLDNFDKKWKNMVSKKTPIPTPDKEKYSDKVGAFEGAGYVPKKVYRPAKNCRMRSNSAADFCPVCKKALEDMLKIYCE